MIVLFSITLFLSAALLFLVQPMIGKMVLPLLGGTPAVWNTCMVFFQAALLAGYAYAHGLPAWLGLRKHAVFHLILLLLPLLVLPLALPKDWTPPGDANPIPWLLVFLIATVGLPVFALSTTAPLIQVWLARTSHTSATDPYFLYAASNLGSMSGLLSYPIVVEPHLKLATQGLIWSIGYGALVLMMFGCAACLWRSPTNANNPVSTRTQRPASGTRFHWMLLAFVPSSLMLSVTMYLTADIAAIPLLWVIPLALYLLTFVLAFGRRTVLPHAFVVRISPMVALILVIVMLTQATTPIWILVPLHLLAFFVISLVCHGELAARRPPVQHLTEFYLWLAIGGVLGGLFNAIVAPVLFTTVVEYPLVLVLACIVRPEFVRGKASNDVTPSHWIFLPSILDFVLPITVGLATLAVVLIVRRSIPGHAAVGIMFAIPAIVCYTFLERPLRFGLSLGALLLAGSFYEGVYGETLHRERSFFGVHQVTSQEERNDKGQLVKRDHVLVHGNTVHGRQSLIPGRQRQPLAYYHRTGPIGQVFRIVSAAAKKQVALVGLGAGALAAYGEPGQHYVFYEIDPAVVHISRDGGYFTYLADSLAHVDYVLGDARLTLKKAPDKEYGMIVMDAFSSDSIPLHLLTREAVALYKQKLADEGLLIFHFSHRYLDFQPMLSDLAHDAGLVCLVMNDLVVSTTDEEDGKSPSRWMVMARHRSDLEELIEAPGWKEVKGTSGRRVWTDDFSNVFSVFLWRSESSDEQ